MSIDDDTIRQLAARREGPTLDFKEDFYANSLEGSAELAKDIIAIANGLRRDGQPGYILIGVAEDPATKTGVIRGFTPTPWVTDSNLQQKVRTHLNRHPKFSWTLVEVDGVKIGVLEICHGRRPFFALQDRHNLKRHVALIRVGSSTDVASPDEIIQWHREDEGAKEETTFAIEVLDAQGNPLPEVTFAMVPREDPRHVVGAYTDEELEHAADVDSIVIRSYILGEEGPIQRHHNNDKREPLMAAFNKEVDNYLAIDTNAEKVNRFILARALLKSTQITFAIRNVSGPTARGVQCSIEFPRGFVLRTGSLREPTLPSNLPTRPISDVHERMERILANIDRPRLYESKLPGFVTVEGTTLHLSAVKVQHETREKLTNKEEIVTVLPPVDGPREGELRYRIWSDDTKPRESTIPFRIVDP